MTFVHRGACVPPAVGHFLCLVTGGLVSSVQTLVSTCYVERIVDVPHLALFIKVKFSYRSRAQCCCVCVFTYGGCVSHGCTFILSSVLTEQLVQVKSCVPLTKRLSSEQPCLGGSMTLVGEFDFSPCSCRSAMKPSAGQGRQ